ncbi:uncharacterized protein LOC133190434 [Saccostrea echinata]|uniref:uncharacterized protein LOC133190434 n=1 Tax=Saccostrea echinata TaxID=191078 RepID=UPI002A83A1AA|nr:uncharacterized protein LOC133190434 [Saccostrea echinata]
MSNKERHDLFYSQARNVLNYNVKRLWFKINPFLEKKKKDETDPSEFIQPQQSTVLCEKLSFSGDIDRKEQELQVGEFWDYLYSDKWEHGCSIRILEGQLFDLLQTKLHILLKKQMIVHHRTFAFARNKREKRGCYKLANEKGCGEIEEILLLEFIYYGRRVEPIRQYGSTCSSYPGISTTTSGITPQRSPPPSEREEEFNPLIRRASLDGRVLTRNLPAIKRRHSTPDKKAPRGRRSASRERGQGSERVKSGDKGKRAIRQPFEIIPKEISSASSDSDYRTQPPPINLKQFRCTERIIYGDDLDTITEEIELKKEDLGFGEEFYLSDIVREPSTQIDHESVVKKLARCKEELQKRREEKRKQEEFFNNRKTTCLPPMPSFDIDHIQLDKTNTDRPAFKFKFLIQEVPSFERLVTILESEDRCDPRYRRSKQLSKRVANRYNLTKDALHQRNLETAELNTNLKKRFEILGKLGSGGKKEAKETKSRSHMMHAASSAIAVPKQGKPVITNIQTFEDTIGEMATKVRGVTDSRECENHVLNHSGKKKPSKDRKKSKAKSVSISPVSPKTASPDSPSTIPDIVLTSPSGQSCNLSVKSEVVSPIGKAVSPPSRASPREFKSVVVKKSVRKKESKPGSKKSVAKAKSTSGKKSRGKANLAPSYIESDTSEEDDTTVSTCFDTKKLNFRYSFEKLKSSKGGKKKKPAFYEILKKYYRVQKTIDALTTPKGSKGKGRKSIFERLMQKQTIKKTEPEFVIGKLKKFSFLKYKKRPTVEVEMANFSTVSMVEFEERLFKALDDFIVRKEHVVSNINGKSVTAITFTKKFAFEEKKWD